MGSRLRHAFGAVLVSTAACAQLFNVGDPIVDPPLDGGADSAAVDAPGVDALDAAAADARADAGCSWFCDDFDEDPWPDPRWDNPVPPVPPDAASVGVTAEVSHSSPRSLRARVASSGASAYRSHSGSGAISRIRCNVWIKIEQFGGKAVVLEVTALAPDGGSYALQVLVDKDTSMFVLDVLGAQGVIFGGIAAPTTSQWRSLQLDVRFGVGATVSYDDGHPLFGPVTAAAEAGAPRFAMITFGPRDIEGTGLDWIVDYDDVRCDVDP